jgi:hypothetical protein
MHRSMQRQKKSKITLYVISKKVSIHSNFGLVDYLIVLALVLYRFDSNFHSFLNK